jgi:hypothetical protein
MAGVRFSLSEKSCEAVNPGYSPVQPCPRACSSFRALIFLLPPVTYTTRHTAQSEPFDHRWLRP